MITLAIVGCGGMGRRHVAGLAELHGAVTELGTPDPFALEVVADIDLARAEALADEAEFLLGRRPTTATSLSELGTDRVRAIDITTATDSHHRLGLEAFELNCDVITEKPLAPSIRQASSLIDQAATSQRVLAVAENVRREPANRFARGLIAAGAIGDVRYLLDLSLMGGDAIILTPWRHRLETGGLLLDVAVHAADVIEYLAGPVAAVSGRLRLDEPRRMRPDWSPVASASFYDSWSSDGPDSTVADAEDVAVAVLDFASGAIGQWTVHLAAHGKPRALRLVHGSRGSLEMPADRSGGEVILTTTTGERIVGQELLELAAAYRLAPIEAAVWGSDRVTHFSADFATIDRKLVAIELADFADAIRSRHRPEVDGHTGRRSMALVLAVGESAIAGGPVDVEAVESGDLHAYGDRIDGRVSSVAENARRDEIS